MELENNQCLTDCKSVCSLEFFVLKKNGKQNILFIKKYIRHLICSSKKADYEVDCKVNIGHRTILLETILKCSEKETINTLSMYIKIDKFLH